MNLQLGMIGLDVRDVRRSIDFYRLLGLAMPDPFPDRPVSLLKMDSGVTLVLAEGFAAGADPAWARPPLGHYQQFLEFFVGDDTAVDTQWNRLTAAGHHGRMSPRRTSGPYAAMVDDPDGNVILISSDPAAAVAPPHHSAPRPGLLMTLKPGGRALLGRRAQFGDDLGEPGGVEFVGGLAGMRVAGVQGVADR
jgi:predicted lactoylglutathione lyase